MCSLNCVGSVSTVVFKERPLYYVVSLDLIVFSVLPAYKINGPMLIFCNRHILKCNSPKEHRHSRK